MNNELYWVTGATGATGRSAIDHLLSKGLKVRAFVHNDDERAATLRAASMLSLAICSITAPFGTPCRA